METLLTNLSALQEHSFIDLDILVEQGLLQASDLEGLTLVAMRLKLIMRKSTMRPLLEKR